MKFITLFSILILMMASCTDDTDSPSFDEKQFVGIWVPFEVIYPDGNVDQGPFANRSVFGVYDESLQVKEDNTYIPLTWRDENDYTLKTEESGKFEVNSSKMLLTEGSWEMEFEIVKLSNEELWLSYLSDAPLLGAPQTLYKLKRKMK